MPLDLTHGFLDLLYTQMVWIEPVSFTFQEGEKETKEITFKKGFWASKYPVTQELYEKVMGENPSHFKGKHRPVEWVSWKDAQLFLEKLNSDKQIKLNDGLAFHLPSEAMWEYAARANEKTQYSGSNVLAEVGWYYNNSYGQTMPVGLKEPNAFGLYDLSGNVWEWCADAYDESINKTPENGLPYLSNRDSLRILRGGSFNGNGSNCRVGYRDRSVDYFHYLNIGFRVFRY